MMLLIDWGNTRLKWCLDQGDQPGRMQAFTVSDETFAQTLHEAWASLPRPTRVVCVSVAGSERLGRLGNWVETHWGRSLEIARAEARRGRLVNGYPDHRQLGADRWIALVGAAARHRGALVVVDAGSAITVDVVDHAGVHLGGWIAPGRRLMYRALSRGTAAVQPPTVEPDGGFGHDTADCVAGGIDACMKGLLLEVRRRMPEDARVFFCGGDSELLHRAWPEATLQPDLVLSGLRCWAGEAADGAR